MPVCQRRVEATIKDQRHPSHFSAANTSSFFSCFSPRICSCSLHLLLLFELPGPSTILVLKTMAAQTQTSSMISTSAPPPSTSLGHLIREHQHHAHRPQSLPIARDSHGRSPFLSSLMQSPRVISKVASPKPTSPAAQLLEALTPRRTRKLSASAHSRAASVLEVEEQAISSKSPLSVHDGKREALISHLETCLQVSGAPAPVQERKEALRVWTSRDQAGQPVGRESIVACEGSPTARALCRAFPESIPTKYSEADAVFSALEGRKVHRALLPVDSSLQGTVHRTYDLLLRYNVHIVGELVQKNEEECGRFWVLSKDACVLPREEASFKTTVAFVLREGLGALHKVMAAFAFRGIPVTKLESRPWRQQPLMAASSLTAHRTYFQYVLFIDFQSSTAARATQNALAQLQEHSSFLRVLGSYPSFHTMALTPRPHIPQATQPQLVAQAPVLVGAS